MRKSAQLPILITALLCTSLLPAEVTVKRLVSSGQVIHVLGGGWDHNANTRPELLLLLESADSLALSEVVYCEVTADDTLAVMWHHRLGARTPAYIVDAGVTDLDGDLRSEIVVLLNYHTLGAKSAPHWLLVFGWNPDMNMFSKEPTFRWNYRGRGVSYLRPQELAIADLDVDGDYELLITTDSPDRMVLIADWGRTGFRVYREFRSKEMASSPWPFSLAMADFNGDLRLDILIVGQSRPPEMLAYINGRDDFHATSVTKTASEPILPATSATGDLNGDGQEEIILPHTDGSLTLVSLAGPALKGVALDTEIPNLLDLAAVDLDGDGASELVYLQADGTVTTSDPRLATPVTGEQILSRLPDSVLPPVSYGSLTILPAHKASPPVVVFPIYTNAGSFIALAEMSEPSSKQQPVLPYEVADIPPRPQPAKKPAAKVDKTPPVIQIHEPSIARGMKRIEQREKQVAVKGRATDESGIFEILVNGEDANLDAQGNFWAEVKLTVGDNRITVQATDINDNAASTTFTVIREEGVGPKRDDFIQGKYIALIIGIDSYSGEWPRLRNAVHDARGVKEVLESQYRFDHIITLFNQQATEDNIIQKLEWLTRNVREEDNLLIYYSGHGELNERLNRGFWVPVDAKTRSVAHYIPNSLIQTFLGGIRSRHTLLVSDACFSGDIFRGRASSLSPADFRDMDRYYRETYKRPSRQAITSGGIEPVVDRGRDGHSVFTYYFLKALKENQDWYYDAGQLYERLKIPVANNSDQTPICQAIKDTGDEGGQFIFVRRR